MYKYIIGFLLFSILGWIWESIYMTIKMKHWDNRGFLYGPYCPIYGVAGMIGMGFFDLMAAGLLPQFTLWQIFLLGFFVSMVLELPTSIILEKLFHATWWDYSDMPLNIQGRTSVPTSLAFGFAAIIFMKFLIPGIIFITSPLPAWLLFIICLLTSALISCDITLTVSALTDFAIKVNSIDERFQDHMTEAVEHFIDTQSVVYLAAVKRVFSFKLPHNKKKIVDLYFDISSGLKKRVNNIRHRS